MEREWPQESRRSCKEDWATKALGLERVGCWIPQRSMVSSAADSSPGTTNITEPPYEPNFTIAAVAFSSSSSILSQSSQFLLHFALFYQLQIITVHTSPFTYKVFFLITPILILLHKRETIFVSKKQKIETVLYIFFRYLINIYIKITWTKKKLILNFIKIWLKCNNTYLIY